jgi:hypothetical protein
MQGPQLTGELLGTDAIGRSVLSRIVYGARASMGVGLAAAVVGLVVESKPQGWFREFTQPATNPSQTVGPARLTTISSTSRWQWWKEAWRAFEKQPARGTGAGSFELSHRLLRSNSIAVVEPHNVPLQFLSETGVIGLLLALGSVAAAGIGVVRVVWRLEGPERAAAVAVGVAACAYLLHSLVDFDWDFVAVSGPFFLSVGVLLGGGLAPPRGRSVAAPVPAALAIAIAYSLLTPWFAQRAADSALGALEAGQSAKAVSDARDAHSLNPVALDPLFVEAGAAEELGQFSAARSFYVRAIDLQPLNWRGWFELGRFEVGLGNDRRALGPLRRAVALDRCGNLALPLLNQLEGRLGLAPSPSPCPG